MTTEKLPEIRNLFGYIKEKKYSLGGVPSMSKTVYFDTDLKGPCIDVFLDLAQQKTTIFVVEPSFYPNIGRSLIITIPLNISSNMTI